MILQMKGTIGENIGGNTGYKIKSLQHEINTSKKINNIIDETTVQDYTFFQSNYTNNISIKVGSIIERNMLEMDENGKLVPPLEIRAMLKGMMTYIHARNKWSTLTKEDLGRVIAYNNETGPGHEYKHIEGIERFDLPKELSKELKDAKQEMDNRRKSSILTKKDSEQVIAYNNETGPGHEHKHIEGIKRFDLPEELSKELKDAKREMDNRRRSSVLTQEDWER